MRQALVSAVVLAVGAGLLIHTLRANAEFFHDDAYITLRYARNLVEGHGLVWNPGEPVEGYTSLVAVLSIAFWHALGIGAEAAARLVNLLAVIGLAAVLFWFLRARARRSGAGLVAASVPVALVLGSMPLATWVRGGLEGPLFAFWVTVAMVATIRVLDPDREPGARELVGAGLALGFLELVRPDGLAFTAVGAAFVLVAVAARPGPRIRRLLAFAGPLTGLVGLHLAIRLAVYGSPVPNTVIAKTTGLPPDLVPAGWAYLGHFLTRPPWLVPLAAVAAVFAFRAPAHRRSALLLAVAIALYCGLIVKAGGDHMPAHRLFLPLIPLAALLVFEGLVALPRRGFIPPVAGILTCGVLLAQLPGHTPQPLDRAAFIGGIVGRHIAGRWPDGTLVALNTAGSTPWFAPDYRYLDMLGLLDPQIARRKITRVEVPWQRMPGHAKGDGRYVLSRQPDVIILGPAEGTTAQSPWFLGDVELVRSPRFHEQYELRREPIDVRAVDGHRRYPPTRSGTLVFTWYARKDGAGD